MYIFTAELFREKIKGFVACRASKRDDLYELFLKDSSANNRIVLWRKKVT